MSLTPIYSVFCEKAHSCFRELACQEAPGTVKIQQVSLLEFKEETLRDHLACCKWVLRIYGIIKCKRNSSISQGVTQLPSLPGSRMLSMLPKKPARLPNPAKDISGCLQRPHLFPLPPAFTLHKGGSGWVELVPFGVEPLHWAESTLVDSGLSEAAGLHPKCMT